MSTVQIQKKDIWNIIKIAGFYCIISASFSLIGLLVPERGPLENPSPGLNLHEISGHILWGMIAGTATLSFRYTILTGLFALLIDSDHLVALTNLDALSRMSHSFAFGIISVVVLMVLFGKRDYKLGIAAIAGLLSHISFDMFSGDDSKFPLYAPFYNHQISFPSADWIYFEIAAVVVVILVTIFAKRKQRKEIISS